jgi:hypothetical protein
MGDQVKITAPIENGDTMDTTGENMEIVEAKEPWCEYILEDGTKIRSRQAVISIVKIERGAPDGTDLYIMQGQTLMQVMSRNLTNGN